LALVAKGEAIATEPRLDRSVARAVEAHDALTRIGHAARDETRRKPRPHPLQHVPMRLGVSLQRKRKPRAHMIEALARQTEEIGPAQQAARGGAIVAPPCSVHA